MALDAFPLWPGLTPSVGGRQAERTLDVPDEGRRLYNETITEGHASLAGDRPAQGRAGNAARSFVIHNGSVLQVGLKLGGSAD